MFQPSVFQHHSPKAWLVFFISWPVRQSVSQVYIGSISTAPNVLCSQMDRFLFFCIHYWFTWSTNKGWTVGGTSRAQLTHTSGQCRGENEVGEQNMSLRTLACFVVFCAQRAVSLMRLVMTGETHTHMSYFRVLHYIFSFWKDILLTLPSCTQAIKSNWADVVWVHGCVTSNVILTPWSTLPCHQTLQKMIRRLPEPHNFICSIG